MSSAFGDQTLNGEHKLWHSNGQLYFHTFYKDGEPEGYYKTWYSNGQPWIHTFYKDGKREGEYKEWYSSNGQLWVHSFYKDGKRDGEYKEWYARGQLQFHAFFKNGTIIDKKFTIHKKHIWIRYFNRLRYRSNLRRLAVVLDKFLILDLIKICAKY